ncbi:uncharacterized protein LOC134231014 isoform X2 [Saccostrea cucullata]|uniref:uncharacterized protein LOC134231014 isoform X2 n=1 Tax=Saccostrea cuccullata TaxID=36930 RepID=UPI002ED0ED49
MEDFLDVRSTPKLSSALLATSVFVHVIGFSSNHWSDGGVFYTGLWEACILTPRFHCLEDPYSAGWFGATQAFETIGLIGGFVGLILIILYIFIDKTAGNRVLFIISLVAVGIAAGSTLLGVIIYGANGSALSWSFALAVIAGLIYGVATALMAIHLVKPGLVQG